MGELDYQANNLRQIAKAIEKHECGHGRQLTIIITGWHKHWEKLTNHFWIGEFACRDGTEGIIIDKRLAEGLQRMREIIGKPIVITSGYRNPEHNRAIGGAVPSPASEGSQHLYGKAADIAVVGMSGERLASVARQAGFTGIGIARTWCHVDVRDTPAEWRY